MKEIYAAIPCIISDGMFPTEKCVSFETLDGEAGGIVYQSFVFRNVGEDEKGLVLATVERFENDRILVRFNPSSVFVGSYLYWIKKENVSLFAGELA